MVGAMNESVSAQFDGEGIDEFPPIDAPIPATDEEEGGAPTIDCGCGLPHGGHLMVWCNGCDGLFHAHCHNVPLRQLDNHHLAWFCTPDCEYKHKVARAHAPRKPQRVDRKFRGFHIVFDNVNWTIISTGQQLNMINYSIIEDRGDFESFSTDRPR
jgi:hypothetical protein